MGAAEAPSSAGRQAAGGRSSQRRGRAALDGGSEAIRQGTRDAGTARRRLAGPVAAVGPTGDSGGVPGWGWNRALLPWPLGATGDADGVTSEVGVSGVALPNRGGFGHRVADGPWAEQ